jgi:hypothetical protein
MLPVTHTDLLIVLAFTVAVTIMGFAFLGVLVYRTEVMIRQGREDTKENIRISRAVAGLVYQEEEKTRALLREHGWPGPSRDP